MTKEEEDGKSAGNPDAPKIRIVPAVMPGALALTEGTSTLALGVFQATGRVGVLGLRVTEELGLAMGARAGERLAVMTAVGMVEVTVEPKPGLEAAFARLDAAGKGTRATPSTAPSRTPSGGRRTG